MSKRNKTVTVPSVAGLITLVGRSGARRVFASKTVALAALGSEFFKGLSPIAGFTQLRATLKWGDHGLDASTETVVYDWMLLDVMGSPLGYADFQEEIAASWRERRWRRFGHTLCTPFGVAVPRTGRHRHGHYYRHPQTARTNRTGQPLREEGDSEQPLARSKSRKSPSAWDDLRLSSRDDRSWKRFRGVQWKGGSDAKKARESIRTGLVREHDEHPDVAFSHPDIDD